MKTAEKVVFNTAVLYAKVAITMVISLLSVPLVLKALGSSDYGLYNLVLGIVTMLAFLNNSMTVSTQRYMSVAMGEGDENRINGIYSSSFILHLILAIGIAIALEIVGVPAIYKLNIEPDRVWSAHVIFQFLIISTFSKVIAVPFDAIMNAHEDMLAFSLIELIDSIVMLVIAFSLQYVHVDKLSFYGFSIAFIAILTLLMKCFWCRIKYKSYKISLRHNSKGTQLREMSGFAGWNLLGSIALMGRNQGVAIIFNLFMGTIANAAFGIANQINGALAQFSSTFQRAINPQLMKSEGMGNRERLHRIAFISSKFSLLAFSLFAIPLIIVMDDVLGIWLRGNVPLYTVQMSRCILIMSILTQASMGLMSSIQATGNIRSYQIIMGALILLNLPVSYFLIKNGRPIYYATIVFVIIEFLSLLVRLAMAKRIVGIEPHKFLLKVVLPVVMVIVPSVLCCLVPFLLVKNSLVRLAIVSASYGVSYVILIWYIILDDEQRDAIRNIIEKRGR